MFLEFFFSAIFYDQNNRFTICYLGNWARVEKFNGIAYLITWFSAFEKELFLC